MVTRVQGILETLILTPGTFDACVRNFIIFNQNI
jgi:hypothetical protein